MDEASMLVISEPDAAVSLSPLRRQVLGSLTQPDSATGIAKRLGITRQKANYHLRALEESGLVELDEIRQRRGLEERVMRRTADVVIADPLLFQDVDLSAKDTAGLTGIVVTASDLIRQAARVAAAASKADQSVATVTLDTTLRVRNPESLRNMVAEIGDVLARHNSEQGLEMRVVLNALPEGDPR